MNVRDLRLSYTKGGLSESEVPADPLRLFERWFGEASRSELLEPNAMALATASTSGMPSVRMVLLKGYDESGFVWYTNYGSRKGRELAESPRASLLFYWPELERQIRIDGPVEKVSEQESDEYFESRPRGHRMGAWVSPQSVEIPSREILERGLAAARERFGEGSIPRPPHWGGYRLRPELFEFWQGRPNRLHDRLEYRCDKGGWVIRRLAP